MKLVILAWTIIQRKFKAAWKLFKNVFLHFINSYNQLVLIVFGIVKVLGWKVRVSVHKSY